MSENRLERAARRSFREQLARRFDWRRLAREALATVTEETDGDGDAVHYYFLGSVLSLAPSGKYYTPFASGNVEACPKCAGAGTTKRTDACNLCAGAGRREVLRGYNLAGIAEYAGHAVEVGDFFTCNGCAGSGRTPRQCLHCGGMGSREAYLDGIFFEVLDELAAEHGGHIQNGDGDALDVFFCIVEDQDAPGAPGAPEATPAPDLDGEALLDAARGREV